MQLKGATSTFMVTKGDTRTALIESAGCFRVTVTKRGVVLQVFTCLLICVFSLILTTSMHKKCSEVKGGTFF